MFIRWRRRPLRREADTLLYALLVRSVWHHGCPRQQLIGYLASIREQYQHAPAHRQAFWRRVEWRLTTLGLEPAMRQRLAHQLATVIPRPTGGEIQDVLVQQVQLQHLATTLAP
jgi:hypothetical protein